MVQKAIILLSFLGLVELWVSCCNCLEPEFYDISHCSLNLENLDNSGERVKVSEIDTLFKEAFGLRVVIDSQVPTCNKTNQGFLFSNSYATSCGCPPEEQYIYQDSIQSINITPVNNYNENIAQNEDISDFFKVYRADTFTEIASFVEGRQSTFAGGFFESSFDILLMDTTASVGFHSFNIDIELSDGRLLESQSQMVWLR